MKKIISTVLALTMAISLCSVIPAMAAVNPYDTVNNTFSLDFSESFGNGASSTDIVAMPTTEDPDNKAMRVGKSGYWRPQPSGARKTMVAGDDVILNFKLMIDSSSTTSNTKAMHIRGGNTSSHKSSAEIMQLKYSKGTTWTVAFMSTGRNSFQDLCNITAGEWANISMVLHLSDGKYDVSVNGIKARNLVIGPDSGSDPFSFADLLEVVFSTTNSTDTTSTYYIDDLYAYAGDELVMDFEDDSADITGQGNLGNQTQILTTKDNNEQDTKALYFKYDGTADTKVESGWRLASSNSNTFITADEVTIGFDFKMDGTYTADDEPENIGGPYILSALSKKTDGTSGAETTPLFGSIYHQDKQKWELAFSEGRRKLIPTGYMVSANEWVSIDVALHLGTATYDGYIDGVLVAKGLKLGYAGSSTFLSSMIGLRNFNFNSINSDNYQSDKTKKYAYYIDNVTYDTWSWTPITATGAALLDSSDAAAADGKARKYTVTVNNPNKFTETACFVLRAFDKDGLMQDVIFEKVNLPVGTNQTFTRSFTNLSDDEDYDVKAFFIDPKTLAPYSNSFATLSSPLPNE